MVQYQHYIPQFILRNFSHPYKPPKEKSPKKRGKARAERGKYAGDKVLNVVDLASDEPQLLESPVSRSFGQDDMYNDVDDTIKSKKDVEKELSKLECQIATIIQSIKKAHEAGEAGLSLTRVERNKLRKFLFIMKYRGPLFFQKYAFEDGEAYDEEDKHLVRAYMAEKGFKKPRDVWLHNLRTILELDMDAEDKWADALPSLMFPSDAQMFDFHCRASYMAFCTPDKQDDEFILTDQCYSVFEGPCSETFNANTGEFYGDTYINYHEFGPISPRLIIVLRSVLLPEALEDMDPKVQKHRQTMAKSVLKQFPDPENAKSILSDLPVAKARNSYTTVVNGKMEGLPNYSGVRRLNDKFTFRFWPISSRHMKTINSVFLDNILWCKSVAFGSHEPFKATLEAYMTNTGPGFKTIDIGEHGASVSRLTCLKKLSAVLKMLGSTIQPVWPVADERKRKPFVQSFDDTWLEMIKSFLEDGDETFVLPETTSFWETYRKLGGSKETFLEDLDQSWRLYKLYAFGFIMSIGIDNETRRIVFLNVLDSILQHLPRRIWLFVKHRRWMLSTEYAMHQEMSVGFAPLYAAKTRALFEPAPEDEVVRVNHTIDRQRLSGLIIGAALSSED